MEYIFLCFHSQIQDNFLTALSLVSLLNNVYIPTRLHKCRNLVLSYSWKTTKNSCKRIETNHSLLKLVWLTFTQVCKVFMYFSSLFFFSFIFLCLMSFRSSLSFFASLFFKLMSAKMCRNEANKLFINELRTKINHWKLGFWSTNTVCQIKGNMASSIELNPKSESINKRKSASIFSLLTGIYWNEAYIGLFGFIIRSLSPVLHAERKPFRISPCIGLWPDLVKAIRSWA